jgi:RNA methyltransferase, TrmH family
METKRITSKFNKKIVHLRKLIDSKEYRYDCGEYAAEGVRFFDKVGEVKELYVREDAPLPKIKFETAYRLDKALFDKVSSTENSQGLIATMKLNILDEKSLAREKRYCLLDRLQDPGNAGAIIRSACAFGLDGIITLPGTVDPFSPKVARASAGALSNIDIISVAGTGKLESFTVICADARGEDVSGFGWPLGFVLVIGNEAGGVSPELRRIAKFNLAIPVSDRVESLNAAVSAGILFYLSGGRKNGFT